MQLQQQIGSEKTTGFWFDLQTGVCVGVILKILFKFNYLQMHMLGSLVFQFFVIEIPILAALKPDDQNFVVLS